MERFQWEYFPCQKPEVRPSLFVCLCHHSSIQLFLPPTWAHLWWEISCWRLLRMVIFVQQKTFLQKNEWLLSCFKIKINRKICTSLHLRSAFFGAIPPKCSCIFMEYVGSFSDSFANLGLIFSLRFPWFQKNIQKAEKISSPSLRWNLKMMVSKWNILFQGVIFRFHVKLWEGMHQRFSDLIFTPLLWMHRLRCPTWTL